METQYFKWYSSALGRDMEAETVAIDVHGGILLGHVVTRGIRIGLLHAGFGRFFPSAKRLQSGPRPQLRTQRTGPVSERDTPSAAVGRACGPMAPYLSRRVLPWCYDGAWTSKRGVLS